VIGFLCFTFGVGAEPCNHEYFVDWWARRYRRNSFLLLIWLTNLVLVSSYIIY